MSKSSRYERICLIVFHGTQSTVQVDFHNVREDKKTSEDSEAIEGTLVGLFSMDDLVY
jgi:hypothetical protein